MSLNQPLIEDLFKQIIGPFAATHLEPLMIEPDNSEDRVRLLADTFDQYPFLNVGFNALIKSIKAQEAEAAIEEKIRFYNTRHTRNWLIVNLINQVLKIKELKLDDATGRLPAKPHDLLKFANQAQLAFGEDGRYKDLAFAGGLMFDFMFFLQRTSFVNMNGVKFDEPINQAFTRAVEQGKLILSLSKHKAKLTEEKYTFLTAFMRQLAQVSLYILKPNEAPEFYKKLATIKHTETIRLAMEMKTFGVNTTILATYLAQSMPIFHGLGEAMSVWGKSLFKLAERSPRNSRFIGHGVTRSYH